MNRLTKRLQQLEGQLPVGCATCRWWDGTVVEDSFNGRSRPDQCPMCGRIVPTLLIVQIEGVDGDDI